MSIEVMGVHRHACLPISGPLQRRNNLKRFWMNLDCLVGYMGQLQPTRGSDLKRCATGACIQQRASNRSP